MELRHLEYFVAVAEELNFTRASRRLHVVQSGVSAAIRSLERDLGAPLFDRSSQKVELTGAGAALLPRARAVLEGAQSARDAVLEARGSLRGTVNIGTMISVDILDLPAMLGRFRADHPAVVIRLRVAASGSAGLVKALGDGDLDVAFLSFSGRAPAGLHTRALAAVRLVLVAPTDGAPSTGSDTASLEEVVEHPFIDFPPGYGIRDVVDRAFAAAGVDRHVGLEVTDVLAGADYVRHGLGLAFLPEFAVPDDPDLRVLTVEGFDLRWNLSVATSATRRASPAAAAFLELVDDYVQPVR
ncbi:MAG: LysR family transcriptional regulator [Propionibacteriales bacterium]|nr:LysR family transcriptional regulator [Propionibacteriales bacterium]